MTVTPTPPAAQTRPDDAAATDEKQAEERRAYWDKGYLILPGLFAPSEAEAMQAEADRLLRSDLVDPVNLRTPFRADSPHAPERIDPVLDVSPLYAALSQDERILGVLRNLFGDEPLAFKDKLIFKLPGVSGYRMHQDQSWWQLCPPDDILSVSVAIDGADGENGGIALYDGYHREMRTPTGERRNFNDAEIAAIDPARKFLPTTRAGDAVIFHSLTPHESGANASPRPRRSLYLSYSAARSGDLHAVYYDLYKAQQAKRAAQETGASKPYFR